MARKKLEKTRTLEPTWKLAAYIRLSREDGEDESLSITNQRKIIDEFVGEYFDDGSSIIDYYVDDGVSGTDYDRPDFQRLMQDIEAKRINCIIVKTPSRAFRNYSDQGYFLENFFPKHQIRFISISNPRVDSFKNPESVSGLELPIMGLMNDRFASQTSEQIRRTFNTKRKRGEFIGAFAPYGYSKDPENKSKLVVDHDAAEIVRAIYHWFVYDGLSKTSIAKKLNEQGVPNPAAYKKRKGLKYQSPSTRNNDGLWSPTTVFNILSNRMYIGHMVQGKHKIVSYKVHDQVRVPEDQWFIKEETHEAIVSKALFDQAQDITKSNTRQPSHAQSVYLFSGLLRCADCQKALRRCAVKNYVYYICRTYKDKSKASCTKHTIREDHLAKLVHSVISVQIQLVDDLASMVEAFDKVPAQESKANRIDALYNAHMVELGRYQKAINSLYLDWKNEDITRDQYRIMKGEFEEKSKRLENQMESLENERKALEEGIKADSPLFENIQKNKGFVELNRGILTSMIDKILVHEDKTITIRFKNDDQFTKVLEYINENSAN